MANRGKAKRADERGKSYARQRLAHDAASARRSSERQRIAETARTTNALSELDTQWGADTKGAQTSTRRRKQRVTATEWWRWGESNPRWAQLMGWESALVRVILGFLRAP